MSFQQYNCLDDNPISNVLQHNTKESIGDPLSDDMNSSMCSACNAMDSIPESEQQQLVGRERLAEIIKAFRESKNLKLRPFSELVGVSHGTIQRLEQAGSGASDEVLNALAQVMPYTYVELKAISLGIQVEDARIYVTAEDVFQIASGIEKAEQLRLMHMLLDNQVKS